MSAIEITRRQRVEQYESVTRCEFNLRACERYIGLGGFFYGFYVTSFIDLYHCVDLILVYKSGYFKNQLDSV